MSNQHIRRKLTAILVADVEGCNKLMGGDQVGINLNLDARNCLGL